LHIKENLSSFAKIYLFLMKKKPKKALKLKKPVKTKSKVTNKLPPKYKTTKNGLELVEDKESKPVRFDNRKYVRISENESREKFQEIGERVYRKELKWVYYCLENNVGFHYYLILKKE
jgi:hypothetical protein